METLLRLLSFVIAHPAGAGAILCAWLISPWLSTHVQSQVYTPRLGFAAEAQSHADTDAISRLFGELRTSMSDYLFVKTERYLHSGIAYREACNHDDEDHDHEHHVVPTLIRTPLEDWRGLVGDIQREVQPWLDPSKHIEHTPGTQLLPWYRMMTLANPHRIRGYRLGAMWLLAENDPKLDQEALTFVEEGIAYNPTAHELYMMKARILLRQKRLEDAATVLRQSVELGVAQRPPGGWPLDGVGKEQENSLGAAIRTEVFVLQRLGRLSEALQRAEQGLRIYGHDPVLEETITELRNTAADAHGS